MSISNCDKILQILQVNINSLGHGRVLDIEDLENIKSLVIDVRNTISWKSN